MKECSINKNKTFCNCTYESCSRKGVCCECLQYHYKSGQFPACLFPTDVEKTYNRSIDNFISTYQKRGKWW